MPWKRSWGSPVVNFSATGRCSSARMFTQKAPDSVMRGWARAVLFTQTSTVGGSAVTLANALTVKPWIEPSCAVVTIVTPVAKRFIAALKLSVDTGTNSDPISNRDDCGVEVRMRDEGLAEGPQCRYLGRVVRRRIGRDLT